MGRDWYLQGALLTLLSGALAAASWSIDHRFFSGLFAGAAACMASAILWAVLEERN